MMIYNVYNNTVVSKYKILENLSVTSDLVKNLPSQNVKWIIA